MHVRADVYRTCNLSSIVKLTGILPVSSVAIKNVFRIGADAPQMRSDSEFVDVHIIRNTCSQKNGRAEVFCTRSLVRVAKIKFGANDSPTHLATARWVLINYTRTNR